MFVCMYTQVGNWQLEINVKIYLVNQPECNAVRLYELCFVTHIAKHRDESVGWLCVWLRMREVSSCTQVC